MTIKTPIKKIIVSRTDSIGDVCLTLPICKALKMYFSDVEILFLGKTYTQPIIESCPYVDSFCDFSELERLEPKTRIEFLHRLNADVIIHVFPNKKVAQWAKQANIPMRIGTSHRFFHWATCNQLLNFSRKSSNKHEAQLNFELLKPFGIEIPSFALLNSWDVLIPTDHIPTAISDLFTGNNRVILHCKSQGSAVEWGLENFMELALALANRNFQVFFTGTEKEGELFRDLLPIHPNVIDVSGKMTLSELIAFIANCQGLVAASTGPLHIAGLLRTRAVGLFSPRKPIHPGRWRALGSKSVALVYDEHCDKCARGKTCDCIVSIPIQDVLAHLDTNENV